MAVADPSSLGWFDQIWPSFGGNPASPHSKILAAGDEESGDHASVLKDRTGLLWTIEIYMGRFFKMDLILDTASDWLIVEGEDCETCEGNKYNIGPSIDKGEAL